MICFAGWDDGERWTTAARRAVGRERSQEDLKACKQNAWREEGTVMAAGGSEEIRGYGQRRRDIASR